MHLCWSERKNQSVKVRNPCAVMRLFFQEKCEMQKVHLGDVTLIAVACRTQGYALMLDSVRSPPISFVGVFESSETSGVRNVKICFPKVKHRWWYSVEVESLCHGLSSYPAYFDRQACFPEGPAYLNACSSLQLFPPESNLTFQSLHMSLLQHELKYRASVKKPSRVLWRFGICVFRFTYLMLEGWAQKI